MKLQVSFDMIDLDKAVQIAHEIAPYTKILEVGTLLIFRHGAKAVERFRSEFPEHEIFADAKIIDRGKESATLLAHAGADWITVMAGTRKSVIHAVCTTAHELKRKVMIDLLDSPSQGQSALEAQSMGADALLFHTSQDENDAFSLLDNWNMVQGNTKIPVFLSGKVTFDTIDEVLALKPDGIVIGRTIVGADNPAAVAAQFHAKVFPESNEGQ